MFRSWTRRRRSFLFRYTPLKSLRTRRRRLERRIQALTGRLRLARENLKKSEISKAESISMVAHELRTPMTSIAGFSKLLLNEKNGPLNEIQHEFCTIIQRNTHQLERLISDLLDLTRLELGRLEMHPSTISFHDLAKEAVVALQGATPAEKQRIRLFLPPQELFVHGDHLRLLQVATNLLSNALKYSPPESPVRVNCQATEEQVTFCVEDHGQPLSSEQQLMVFEKFYRIKSASHRKISGTGLGLAICRTIVFNHHGKLWTEHSPRGGNQFCFSLPRVSSPGEPAK